MILDQTKPSVPVPNKDRKGKKKRSYCPTKNPPKKLQSVVYDFREWLAVLGYHPTSVYDLPKHLQSFLDFLKGENPSPKSCKNFIEYLKERGNLKTGKPLSNNYLNKYLQALKLYSKFLKTQGKPTFKTALETLKAPQKEVNILSIDDVKLLYKVAQNDLLGLRDKAMLSIFYGCGLRRNEGVNLNVKDVLLEAKLLHVRKGKNHKERVVPISNQSVKIIKEYLELGRPYFKQNSEETAFFISKKGKRAEGQSLALRLKSLQNNAQIHPKISLHGLRHSIATHLLKQGMSLQKVSRFLGHSSLESTQIYTHISV